MIKKRIYKKNKKIELLAPAGNLEKLEIAINYGADAVYLSGKNFNLRNFSENFSLKKMKIARKITRNNNVKMYLAINSFIRNEEIPIIKKYLKNILKILPDAIIISDPAIFIIAKKTIPRIPIHISTQSNITNYYSVMFWEKLGAKRVNLARELNLEEIKKIIYKNKVEIETFVHGAMCMSYSGKCLLSNFITMRESNKGECCQACRFQYSVMEQKRPGEYFPIHEDNKYSYTFNSKDLCMINYIDKLIKLGITSLKIEGRMKSSNYLASITKIYREAINCHYEKTNYKNNTFKKNWLNYLLSTNNRGYSTGFFFKSLYKEEVKHNNNYKYNSIFVCKIIHSLKNGKTLVKVKNKIQIGDKIKVISNYKLSDKYTQIYKIYDPQKKNLLYANAGSLIYISVKIKCKKYDIIQKIKN